MGHVAGVAGLEPTHDGIKTRCLTDLAIPHRKYYSQFSGYLWTIEIIICCWEPFQVLISCVADIWDLYKRHHIVNNYMASAQGFEPRTHSLEGCCSIQLSYAPIVGADDGNRTHAISLEGWSSTIELHPQNWSGRRDSNSRPSPWQGDALPLSHFRKILNWWREKDLNLRSLRQQIYSLPPLATRESLHLINMIHKYFYGAGGGNL